VTARACKEAALQKAFRAFTPSPAYQAFIQKPWVRLFAIFMAFKQANQMRCWLDWPEEQKNWPVEKAADLSPFDEEIRYQMFAQFLFDSQWTALKRYANERSVRIIGDMPIYVGLDSLDVWANRGSFLLDKDGRPTYVAGVPPDYFSSTGQRWGNPLYDWDFLQADGFRFWLDRLRGASELFDVIRIDHFRGFDTYWKIPADCPTAQQGEWVEAPGYALFDAIFKEMPDLVLIAEDLGMLRDEVYALRDHYALPGMKVLQFTFTPGARITGGDPRMVAYTGTHDNQTTAGWYRSMSASKRLLTQASLCLGGYWFGSVPYKLVRLALHDAAELAVLPAQDLMGLSDEARINTPGTVGSPNWEWKLPDLAAMEEGLRLFGKEILKSGRGR
jgi:4-alpha-glucanotransferase